MKLRNLLTSCAALVVASIASAGDLVAIKAGHVETVSHGCIQHAVILVEDGKIVTIGRDLPIERGIPVIDAPDLWVVPGFVDPYSRVGLEARGGSDFNPQIHAEIELFPRNTDYAETLKAGVTTLGLYPPGGGGMPGQACVVRPKGDTAKDMLIKSGAYVLFVFRADARSKKMLKDAFEKATEYTDKEKKAREKFEKDASKKKDDKKEEKKDEKKEEKKEGEKEASPSALQDGAQDDAAAQDKKDEKTEKTDAAKGYVAPEADEKVKPFLDLRAGKLRILVTIFGAGDWLHFAQALGDEKVGVDLRVPLTRDTDMFEVAKAIGEKKLRVLMEPEITTTPGTLRQRNLPAEFVAAGAKLVLLPRGDSPFAFKTWPRAVGEIISAGLDRNVALRAMTLEPAEMLGVADRVGSIDKGKDANLLFFSGDPFEPTSKLKAVMLEGRIVHGEVQQ
ncbi:MAG: amidohydrolase family protein [Planctomycetes bacterium]|nr:amidohydrolase family protein [Planctomycetota bacterium]